MNSKQKPPPVKIRDRAYRPALQQLDAALAVACARERQESRLTSKEEFWAYRIRAYGWYPKPEDLL